MLEGILTPCSNSRDCPRDLNPLDRLMLGGVLTPLPLPDGDLNPSGIQLTSGPICTPLVTVYESMITYK